MTTPLEKLTLLFEEIAKGNLSVKDAFFEVIWVNFTRLAHQPEAEPLLHKIYDWADKNAAKYPDLQDHIILAHGFIAFHQDKFDIGHQLLNKAYDLFSEKNDADGMAAANICVGFVHRSTGDLDLALKYGLNGMEQLARTGNLKMYRLLGCYWIGSLYADTGHLNEALGLFKDALEMDFKTGVDTMAPRLLNGMAGVYMKQKNYPLALENFQKAMDLSNETTEKTFKARGLTDMGDYHAEMNNYPLAIKYNMEALEMRREMNVQNGAITNLVNLGNIYQKQKQFDKAIATFNEALELAEKIKLPLKMYPIHRQLSDIYLEMGDIAESFKHYKTFHEIKEEVSHDDLERKVNNQVKLFEAQMIEKENAIIKAQKIEIEIEKKRSDDLLLNILPEEVAEELKAKGTADARQYDEVTVLFTDFKNFTGISETMTAKELVEEIHTCFKAFDEIVEKYNIEKIKTIGDSYMCAGGLPVINKTNAEDVVRAGLEIRQFIEQHISDRIAAGKVPFEIRIGIHTGPVVAGIVGIRKYAYDIWGDTVNTASRMESSGEAGKVNISGTTYELVKDKFVCIHRGKIQAKGKGEIDMYFVN